MKRTLLFVISALIVGISTYASEVIPLVAHFEEDDMPISNGHPKAPMRPPVVYIEDYTLSFSSNHPDYILNIKDEEGDVVYSATVFSAITQVTLPSNLSGDYEIELLMGNWKFTGWIEL